MKRLLWLAGAGAYGLAASAALAAPETYDIDPEHFSIGFTAGHLGYDSVIGMFLEGGGSFTFDAEAAAVTDLRVEIEADSVFTNHKKRDKHLRSPDFLNAREFRKIIFTGTSVEKTSETTGLVHGELELTGRKRPVTLEVTLNKSAVYPIGHKKQTLGISARTSFLRSEFAMAYGVDNGLVGDEITLMLEFEANKR